MGVTNIRVPTDLLRTAGNERSEGAVMPEFNRPIVLNGHFFEQEELDGFADVLRHPLKDVWLHRSKDDKLVPGQADAPIDRPGVWTSSGLEDNRRHVVPRTSELEEGSPKPPALAFVIVIRGRSAALCSKVRVLFTLKAAAAAMFEELVNGYSTVFSAAILRADVGKLDERAAEFRKVDSREQLYDSTGDEKTIAFLCGGERYN